MRTSSARSAEPIDTRILESRVERSFSRAPKRGTKYHAYHIPRKLWDRIVLLMFTCCLFTFLHALFGFGDVDRDSHALNDTFARPRPHLSTPPPWDQSYVASNEDQKIRASSVTRVIVDWHGDYELLPSTASILISPPSIPQDAFPDPTPPRIRPERGRALDEGSSMITKVKTPMSTPPAFYDTPYDPFRLAFEDGGEYHGLYPVAGPPRTARARRFGRCFPGEACL